MGKPKNEKPEETLDENGLTAAQEAFCRSRVAGLSPAQAYRDAYPEKSANYEYKAGKKMDDMERIRKRIQALREQAGEELIADILEIKADLTRIAMDETRPDGVRLKAYDQLTRMMGGYNDKIEVGGDFGIQEKRDALSGLLEG